MAGRWRLVNFRVTSGGGSVFGGSALTNEQGEARERWTLGSGAANSQRVEARAVDSGTGAAIVFATFRASARADVPALLVLVDSTMRSGPAGLPLADSLAVRVLDRFGNPVSGAVLGWSAHGGGSLSPAMATSDASGLARAQWTLGPRMDTVQVAEGGLGALPAASFRASANVPTDAMLQLLGNQQSGTVGEALPQPLLLVLRLPDGRPIAGAPVTWSAAAGSGSLMQSAPRTDA